MGAGIWLIFMLIVMAYVPFYAEDANDKAKEMSTYESANFKHKRVCFALKVAAVIGIITATLCMWLFK